ncbi:Enoyl-CoA hydratase/carnithine racemase [Collimonas sp. OK242]|jgi:enoyl-CoA hydratase/carnithine racemase|uniref:enoyl-CoA hydratase/isomerase family protein n=1 Tax=Collimonas sp. OK242 TaxID=1798195 RepID=UPI0008995620|nr:enoyl-CoA hydratase/isomerase family protein [Collimonas sp. OK242]SDY03398.1 Enoyl-CoA hydratase/carnithine racemase [Collimonas sp. OK242]
MKAEAKMAEMNLTAAAAPALFEELTTDNGKRIGIATLNVEKTLNAISLEMVDLLDQQLRAWAADPQLAMVVLQAAGDKAFCAGGDLQGLYRTMLDQHAAGRQEDIRSNPYACDFFEREYRLDYLIHTYPKPILAWGHGIVMGGGIGLMAGASHRVVTEKSRLAMPEITIGLYPDVGGTWFLNRMPGQIGLFLALSGASIGAADAIFARLADHRINHAQKQPVLAALLSQPWDGRQDDVLLSRVLQNAERQDAQTWVAGPTPLHQHFELINQLCSAPTLAEVVHNIVELKTEDPWLQKGIATLLAGSPASAWLSHALQKRARHMSLAEVFRLEYVVSLHCAARADFAEGIRALIIDKDRRPRWQPATLAAVTDDWGNGFFDNPWPEKNHPLADLV